MDAGCGVGSRLVAAREMGSDVVGVDISFLPIVRCRRMGFAVYRACVTATGFSSFRSDAVTFCNVIGHIPAMAEGSGEVPRILRPGGVAAKLGPDANYLKARLGRHSYRNYPRSVV